MDVIGNLRLAVRLYLPFIEAAGGDQTPLSPLPRAAIARGGLHRFDARIDRGIAGRQPVRKEWNQTPPQPFDDSVAAGSANDGHQLGRRDGVARREIHRSAQEIELALNP